MRPEFFRAHFSKARAIIQMVMRMKKYLILIFVLILVLSGIFLWKGGHHAIFLSDALEEWLDADQADQSLTLQFSRGGFYTDDAAGQVRPKVDQWIVTADTFWTEYGDDEVYGLTVGGITAYLRDGVLYMDTGKAYALPDLYKWSAQARRLALGILLHGRVTKNGNTYHLRMETGELELSASVTVDRTIQNLTVQAVLPDEAVLHATLTPKTTQSHPIPQPVADAMVLAQMERPMSLWEPLEILLPAMEDLLPLSGQLELGIASGILELSETVELTIRDGNVSIARSGIQMDLSADLSRFSPAALGLLALRSGTFTQQEDLATVELSIPGDATAALTESLIPQAAGLGITYDDSTLTLSISNGQLTGAAIKAGGSVPFLFTTIPVSFTANLTIT